MSPLGRPPGPTLTRAQRQERGMPLCATPWCHRHPGARRGLCRTCWYKETHAARMGKPLVQRSRVGPDVVVAQICMPRLLWEMAKATGAGEVPRITAAEWVRRAMVRALSRVDAVPETAEKPADHEGKAAQE